MFNKLTLSHVGYALGATQILSDINITIEQGQRVVIAGKSGCGKSTLLELCAGIRQPTSGVLFYDSTSLADISYKQLLALRSRVGFAFQQHALIHNYPLFDNLALPLRYHLHISDHEIDQRVCEMLSRFNLLDQKYKLPEALAVGQARCASVARALIMDPSVLFLDEPTSSLDPITTALIVGNLQAFSKQENKTLIIVSHNTFLMKELNCIIKILSNGTVHDFDPLTTQRDSQSIDSFLLDHL